MSDPLGRILQLALLENKQQYRQMMQSLVDSGVISTSVRDQYIGDLRKRLLRNDRITWAIKWIKYDILYQYVKIEDTPENRELFNKATGVDFTQANSHEYMIALDIINDDYDFSDGSLLNNIVWTNKTPTDLNTELRDALDPEVNYKRKVELQSGDKLILDYGNYGWYRLNRGSCDKEGNAGNHCGNIQGYHEGDTLFSFRRKTNDSTFVILTFVLNRDGYFTEMRGISNTKPEPKYHKVIADLFSQPWCNGTQPVNYNPGDNFEWDDLSEKLKQKVLDANPKFETSSNGMIQEMEDWLYDRDYSFNIADDAALVLINTADILEHFPMAKRVYELFSGTDNNAIDFNLEDAREKVLSNLPYDVSLKIGRYIAYGKNREIIQDIDAEINYQYAEGLRFYFENKFMDWLSNFDFIDYNNKDEYFIIHIDVDTYESISPYDSIEDYFSAIYPDMDNSSRDDYEPNSNDFQPDYFPNVPEITEADIIEKKNGELSIKDFFMLISPTQAWHVVTSHDSGQLFGLLITNADKYDVKLINKYTTDAIINEIVDSLNNRMNPKLLKILKRSMTDDWISINNTKLIQGVLKQLS